MATQHTNISHRPSNATERVNCSVSQLLKDKYVKDLTVNETPMNRVQTICNCVIFYTEGKW